ncbi:MAG: hypothetical protein ACOC4J_05225 [Bacteroidota bacterium]
MSSEWIIEYGELFTDWSTNTNTVSFTVAFENKDKSRALLAMLEDTHACTAYF